MDTNVNFLLSRLRYFILGYIAEHDIFAILFISIFCNLYHTYECVENYRDINTASHIYHTKIAKILHLNDIHGIENSAIKILQVQYHNPYRDILNNVHH